MPQHREIIVTDPQTIRALIKEVLQEILQPDGATIATPDTILTPKEVARMLRVSDQEVYDAVRDGALPADRRGRCWRIRSGDVGRWKRHNVT